MVVHMQAFLAAERCVWLGPFVNSTAVLVATPFTRGYAAHHLQIRACGYAMRAAGKGGLFVFGGSAGVLILRRKHIASPAKPAAACTALAPGMACR